MVQVAKQSLREKLKIYNKQSKKKIIDMLIACNDLVKKSGHEYVSDNIFLRGHEPIDTRTTPYKCPVCGGNGMVPG